ncbi:MAG TPA: transposase, partial [Solirubrobacteraceae bacterium]|nr:transposase [Solirubrobacteraceae bacterium]
WLPSDHLARFVIETVDELDLSAVYGYYRLDGRGHPAHDPAMMVALVLYAYAVGVTSSRAIERRCVEDVAFRFISADRQPDHATVARFLTRHRGAISELFVGVLGLCVRAGMVRVGTIAVDSTKLAANASMHHNHTYEGLRDLAERIIEEAIETDRREDELYGDRRGDELPEELADPRTRKAKIRELLEQARRDREAIEAQRQAVHERQAQREQTPRGQRQAGRPPLPEPNRRQQTLLAKKYNVTDPDSGIVRHRGMLMQGYNVQAAVADGQVIIATRVSGNAGDGGRLEAMVDAADHALAGLGLDTDADLVVADAGYWHTTQIARLKERGRRVLVPPPQRKRGRYPSPEAPQMQAELATPDGRRDYQRRQQIVEPVFAHWKHIRQITRVWRRGKPAVQAEIDLIATTHNLLKLYRATPTTA